MAKIRFYLLGQYPIISNIILLDWLLKESKCLLRGKINAV